MANVQLAQKYTDERYISKRELVNELGTSLIDDIWKDIEAYRQAYQKRLTIKTVAQTTFYYVATDLIRAKISNFAKKLENLGDALALLETDASEKAAFEQYAKIRLMKDVGFLEGAIAQERQLHAVLAGYQPADEHVGVVMNGYLDALKEMGDHFYYSVNEDLIGTYYQLLCGAEGATCFYRVRDPQQRSLYTTMQFSTTRDYAPYEMIPSCIENLIEFDCNENVRSIVRAFASLFYIDYIKPFNNHNETTSALIAKTILGQEFGACAKYIPLEAVLVKSDRYKAVAKEVQKTNDLTYVILFGISHLTNRIEDLTNSAINAHKKLLREEFYAPDALKPVNNNPAAIQLDLFEEKKEEPAPVVQQAAPAPAVEESKPEPVVEAPAPTPISEPAKEPLAHIDVTEDKSGIRDFTPISMEEPENTATAPIERHDDIVPVKSQEETYEEWRPTSDRPTIDVPLFEGGMYQPEPQHVSTPLFEKTSPSPAYETPLREEVITKEEDIAEDPISAEEEAEENLIEQEEIAPVEEEKEAPVAPVYKAPQAGEEPKALTKANDLSISSKVVKEYAKYIMETNPDIRKLQALFYASHATKGRFYTIQDYKRTMHVVYETARTSMDNLAAHGFYKKIQIKNKFVYTPADKGENE